VPYHLLTWLYGRAAVLLARIYATLCGCRGIIHPRAATSIPRRCELFNLISRALSRSRNYFSRRQRGDSIVSRTLTFYAVESIGVNASLPARRYANSAGAAMDLCLSATSRCSIETDERIELDFGTGASSHLPYTSGTLSPKTRTQY